MSKGKTIKWLGFGLPADELPIDETLDYETFTRTDEAGWPLYNNFPHFFTPTPTGDIYRKSPIFERFKQENPELLDRVTGTVRVHWAQRNLRSMNPDLYEAYTKMRSYELDGKPVLNYPDLFA